MSWQGIYGIAQGTSIPVAVGLANRPFDNAPRFLRQSAAPGSLAEDASTMAWSTGVSTLLHASGATGSVEIAPYLTKLCGSLAVSMIGDTRPIFLNVVGEAGTASSREAENLGLIVTEAVMNALKHAFPSDKAKGQITVTYDRAGTDWKLSISDNGVGKSDGVMAYERSGLGTGIIKALSAQLDAQVETLTGPEGTTVSITHAISPAKA